MKNDNKKSKKANNNLLIFLIVSILLLSTLSILTLYFASLISFIIEIIYFCAMIPILSKLIDKLFIKND